MTYLIDKTHWTASDVKALKEKALELGITEHELIERAAKQALYASVPLFPVRPAFPRPKQNRKVPA